jgi:transcriptional regulator with XRE-family HTH domain
VAKTFAEYAREREVQMSPESRELGRAFDAAAMFGSLIYRARKVRRLRQIDLAEASGVTQADISRIERGMIVPKVTTLLKLVEALDAQLQFVLLPDDELADDQRDLVTLKVRIG